MKLKEALFSCQLNDPIQFSNLFDVKHEDILFDLFDWPFKVIYGGKLAAIVHNKIFHADREMGPLTKSLTLR